MSSPYNYSTTTQVRILQLPPGKCWLYNSQGGHGTGNEQQDTQGSHTRVADHLSYSKEAYCYLEQPYIGRQPLIRALRVVDGGANHRAGLVDLQAFWLAPRSGKSVLLIGGKPPITPGKEIVGFV